MSLLLRQRSRPTAPPPDPGDQTLLDIGDLSFVGTFKGPHINGGACQTPMMTVRRNGGVLRTLWVSSNGFYIDDSAGSADVYEATCPEPSMTPGENVCSIVHNYGHDWVDLIYVQGSYNITQIDRCSMFWDETQNAIVIFYRQNYSGADDPCFILGFINDTTHTASWKGPYLSAAGSKQTQGYGCVIPQDYADAYLAGKRYGLGSGNSSIDAANAFAPVIHATTAPAISTPGWPDNTTALSYVTLLGGDSTHQGRRPGDYLALSCGTTTLHDLDPTSPSRTELTGYFTELDSPHGAVWIDWADKYGVLFTVQLARGHCWYRTIGNGFFTLTSEVGSFVTNETLTGGTSGYTATVKASEGIAHRVDWQQVTPHDFTIGETITGGTSGATAVIATQHRFDACLHGKRADSSGITGPVCKVDLVGDAGQVYGVGFNEEPFFSIYDPLDFVPVAGGNVYDPQPRSWAYMLDISSDYQMIGYTEPAAGHGGPTGPSADETTRRIFVAHGANVVGDIDECYVNVFEVA